VEVDHRPEQIGIEGIGRAEVSKASHDPDEGLVNEVLGVNPVPRQQVREPDRSRDVASVQIAQPVGRLRLAVGQTVHLRSGQESVRAPHAIP
jgi:hypothetical protein